MFEGDISFLCGFFIPKIKRFFCKNPVSRRKCRFLYKKDFIELEDSHDKIKKLLLDNKPCMIARFGFTEAQIVGRYLLRQKGVFTKKIDIMKKGNLLYDTGGFFSCNGKRLDEDICRFAELMIESSKFADLLGATYTELENFVINSCCPQAELTEFDNLRIMAQDKSWGKALENKKVLVVSPFSKSIQSQYKRRTLLWKNQDILPEFTLITYQAVQTIAGNDINKYYDWFSALDKMKNDIDNIDFDIAIIGCGAYGFPLAAHCKMRGKKAIHLGGQTQICFGIYGKRWENLPYYSDFINQYWVRPLPEETPKNFLNVENGCYW